MKINEATAKRLSSQLLKWMRETDKNGKDKGNIFYEDFIFIDKLLSEDEFNNLLEFDVFKIAISKAKKIQEVKLQKYGAADRLNVQMTKFILEKKHNWEGDLKNQNKIENNNNLNFEPDGKE